MTHYLLDSRDPHAIITCNKQELKLYQGNFYYLNNGDNFEIRIFNPLSVKIGAEIIFNSVKKSNRLLVLNPGQDVTLDRFVDEQKKMVYETYEVDANNKVVQKAIKNNGLIEIKFYKETQNYGFTTFNTCNFNTRTYNQDYWFPSTTSGSVKLRSCSKGFGGGTTSTNSSFMSQDNSNLSQDMNFAELNEETMETGRVEKGETSNQYLKEIQVEFETFPFKTVTYKLLPVSQKSYESKEIRLYCTSCGLRIRKDSWSYCPKCGNKI